MAFLTLLERKVLGFIQIRKGPNKVGFIGLLQPFSDAIKLFVKENSILLKSNYLFYLVSPVIRILLILLLWNNLPFYSHIIIRKFNLILVLCIISLGVYTMIIAGWSSNSVYSLIGSLRSIAQTVSYEVRIILIILILLFLIERFNFYKFFNYQYYIWFIIIRFPVIIIFFVSLLAELNRTPFDFAEGESELVSGFNTEYIRGIFALIFIAEYGIIIFIIYLFSIFYLGGNFFSFIFFIIYLFILFIVIWVRGTFPRFRYDNLIYLTWISYLPRILNYLIFILRYKLIFIFI